MGPVGASPRPRRPSSRGVGEPLRRRGHERAAPGAGGLRVEPRREPGGQGARSWFETGYIARPEAAAACSGPICGPFVEHCGEKRGGRPVGVHGAASRRGIGAAPAGQGPPSGQGPGAKPARASAARCGPHWRHFPHRGPGSATSAADAAHKTPPEAAGRSGGPPVWLKRAASAEAAQRPAPRNGPPLAPTQPSGSFGPTPRAAAARCADGLGGWQAPGITKVLRRRLAGAEARSGARGSSSGALHAAESRPDRSARAAFPASLSGAPTRRSAAFARRHRQGPVRCPGRRAQAAAPGRSC